MSFVWISGVWNSNFGMASEALDSREEQRIRAILKKNSFEFHRDSVSYTPSSHTPVSSHTTVVSQTIVIYQQSRRIKLTVSAASKFEIQTVRRDHSPEPAELISQSRSISGSFQLIQIHSLIQPVILSQNDGSTPNFADLSPEFQFYVQYPLLVHLPLFMNFNSVLIVTVALALIFKLIFLNGSSGLDPRRFFSWQFFSHFLCVCAIKLQFQL